MKNKIIIAALLISLTGCGDAVDAVDQEKCLNEVQNIFPESEVKSLNIFDEGKYKFLVRLPSQEIRYIETMSYSSTKITKNVIVFKGEE